MVTRTEKRRPLFINNKFAISMFEWQGSRPCWTRFNTNNDWSTVRCLKRGEFYFLNLLCASKVTSLCYWNCSGDWGPQMLPSRAICWPALHACTYCVTKLLLVTCAPFLLSNIECVVPGAPTWGDTPIKLSCFKFTFQMMMMTTTTTAAAAAAET